MFAPKTKVEVVLRVCMSVMILINALAPTTAFALGNSESDPKTSNETVENAPRLITEQKPLYFDLPQYPQLQGTSPEGDEPISPIPPKDPVEFTLVADPAIVRSNGMVSLDVSIRNNTAEELVGVTFIDVLEPGVQYVEDSSSPVTFDSNSNQVKLEIGSVALHEEHSFSYTLSITPAKQSEIAGSVWLHSAELKSDESSIELRTSAAIAVDLPAVDTDIQIAPVQVDGGWNDLGQVEIYMPEDAVGDNAAVMASPIEDPQTGPELQFDLKVFETSLLTIDAVGELSEQTVALVDEFEGTFEEPAYLEINLEGYIDLNNIPAGQEPYVATYDEEHEIWVKVPILESDHESNTVTVEAAHFSTWGAGLGSSLPQNGANVLLFDQPYTSLFTGSSRYSIPIWTPAGRAGMQPDLSLSYSSGTVDGVLGDVQAPWVGVGWNMDGVEIVRKIMTDEKGYGYRNEFALTLNGSLYQLIRSEDPAHLNRYYTDQAAFLYIELHNHVFGNPSPNNTTGEWWEVVTSDGTHYRLGWNEESEQLALMYGYSCTTENCATPDGAYASLGYAGSAEDLVAMRWRVDKVTDVHGNYMEFHYAESQPDPLTTLAPFDRESYLQSISYGGYDDPFNDPNDQIVDIQPLFQVYFDRESRTTVGDIPNEFNVWDNIDSQLLAKIRVYSCSQPCSVSPGTNDRLVRSYDFEYSVLEAPNENGTLVLTSLKIGGGGYTDNGQPIPYTEAPTVRFTYESKPNKYVSGSSDDYDYPRLTTIENGSGGKLSFTYEHDGRLGNSWYNYRVKSVEVHGGLNTVKKQSYTYATPVYSGQGGDPSLGSLIGYTSVTESVLDFNNGDAKISDTKHTFGTQGLDTGHELQTEFMDAAGTVLQKTTSAYVTDNSKAPFFGWNYRYLGESASYTRSGGSLVLTSRTTYYNDPSTGNPLLQSTYLGSSLYRKTYYEYLMNPDYLGELQLSTGDPNLFRYIPQKLSRVLVVDAGNWTYSDTRYHYDRAPNVFPKIGYETLVQNLVNNSTQPADTVDTLTKHDAYGHAISTNIDKGYGTADQYPSNSCTQADEGCSESQTIYGDSAKIYATQTIDPLGNITEVDYLYTLGVPYQITDPNKWVTKTMYDGLGRTLSVTPPGLDQPSTVYIYPPLNENGTISSPHSVEMQILDTIASPWKYRSVWGIYDGAGRMIQTQVDAGGPLLVNTSVFNAQGLVYKQSLPNEATAAGGNYTYTLGTQFTTTEYDALGRVKKVTAPGNIVSEMLYDGLTTTSIDPNGNKISRTSDGLGRMTAVAEFSNAQDVYATTTYFYDAADRLIRVKDAQFNTTEIRYDWLGRKLWMNDPDMGEWNYGYDASGNMVSQKDAREAEPMLTFSDDKLNRLVGKNVDANSNTYEITYLYGNTPGEIGLRTEMHDLSGSAEWTYQDFGRTVTEERTIGKDT